MTCPENTVLQAQVTGFSPDNSFAYVATNDADFSTVTFSLSSDVWSGGCSPQKGEVVILEGVSRFPKGWRALKARRFLPSDEK